MDGLERWDVVHKTDVKIHSAKRIMKTLTMLLFKGSFIEIFMLNFLFFLFWFLTL